jgi:hypothetical protein
MLDIENSLVHAGQVFYHQATLSALAVLLINTSSKLAKQNVIGQFWSFSGQIMITRHYYLDDQLKYMRDPCVHDVIRCWRQTRIKLNTVLHGSYNNNWIGMAFCDALGRFWHELGQKIVSIPETSIAILASHQLCKYAHKIASNHFILLYFLFYRTKAAQKSSNLLSNPVPVFYRII